VEEAKEEKEEEENFLYITITDLIQGHSGM
jgi:hypothetical protein